MSFYTSLTGLQAAQTDLGVISHNLANVSTNGFKKSRSEFADVIASSVSRNPTSAIGSGTVVKANRQQFSQGNLVQSQSSLDLAISGDGFFAVKPKLDGETINYTRNGAFLVDADRYVVDGQGAHLLAYPADGSGAVVAAGMSSAAPLRLPATSGTPVPTANVALQANLPAGASVPAVATFDRFNPASFNQSTQTTIYDAEGNAQTMTNYFRRDTVGATSNWSVFTYVGNSQITAGGNPSITLTFDATGALTAPTTPTTFDPFIPAGSPNNQVVALDFGTSTRQTSAPFDIAQRTQDGEAVGQLQGVTINSEGLISVSFSNGEARTLGKVLLANFSNPTGLRQLGNSTWASTGLSGTAITGEAGSSGFGNLLAGTIERSNVDITEELVGLIAAQRSFQANAKALETDNQISQTIFNIR
ncbi:flagellar hook protein FlgE [Sphingomonas sp.]|uniref:flagellar hook protein FlgE n=1 Tax=Sphingomonas sp. TaxID=28214 RepID=UPI001DF43C3E|nr:flagellar hook protein FlgE [Sphingomonas sp.]MBX9795374.1 flagellar hook protein FlgE [Sphingomonas sp.]